MAFEQNFIWVKWFEKYIKYIFQSHQWRLSGNRPPSVGRPKISQVKSWPSSRAQPPQTVFQEKFQAPVLFRRIWLLRRGGTARIRWLIGTRWWLWRTGWGPESRCSSNKMGNEGERYFCSPASVSSPASLFCFSWKEPKKTTMNISEQEINKSRINIDVPEGRGTCFFFSLFLSADSFWNIWSQTALWCHRPMNGTCLINYFKVDQTLKWSRATHVCMVWSGCATLKSRNLAA